MCSTNLGCAVVPDVKYGKSGSEATVGAAAAKARAADGEAAQGWQTVPRRPAALGLGDGNPVGIDRRVVRGGTEVLHGLQFEVAR